MLGDEALVADLEAFVVDTLLVPGRVNALAQRLIQLTMPGVPDVYQGTELWDLSLVDPDNRRPVDYALRSRLLVRAGCPASAGESGRRRCGQAARRQPSAPPAPPPTRAVRSRPAATPRLAAIGPLAAHVVAFSRGGGAITVAPRLPVRLANEGGWDDTTLELPAGPVVRPDDRQ